MGFIYDKLSGCREDEGPTIELSSLRKIHYRPGLICSMGTASAIWRIWLIHNTSSHGDCHCRSKCDGKSETFAPSQATKVIFAN